MTTDELTTPRTTEELLELLAEESIRKSHNSVSISFRQMLAYIDKVVDKVEESEGAAPQDILPLLKAYRAMAEKFYKQFESSLLAEIVKQRDTMNLVDDVVKHVEGLRNNVPQKATLAKVLPLLKKNRAVAQSEYENLKKDFPVLMQSAMDKLRDEWQRLSALALASQTLTENEKLGRALKVVVEVAAHSIGVDKEKIIIVPGSAFALNFFTYVEDMAALTIPIYSVQTPWEWSVFWHELAGYKVRQLKKSKTLEAVGDRLNAFRDVYKPLNEHWRGKLLDLVVWDNNQFSRAYLSELLSGKNSDLSDLLGGFEHQFEQIEQALLSGSGLMQIQSYDQFKNSGWCVDWFKELFEDTWSVLTFGEPFLGYLEDVLTRNAKRDSRHPPLEIRLSVAKEVLKLSHPTRQIESDPPIVDQIAARQVLKLISLLVFAARKFESPDFIRLADPQIIERQKTRDELLKMVSQKIQRSIKNWSGKFLSANSPSGRIKNSAKRFLNTFSDPVTTDLLLQLDKYEEANPLKLDDNNLLLGKDYRQLLELSFLEVDYHVAGDFQLTEMGGNKMCWVNPHQWNSTEWDAQRMQVGEHDAIPPGWVKIKNSHDNTCWRVNNADWQVWYAMAAPR
jgi:hypothetical protein